VVGPLLSRTRVFVLEPLDPEAVESLLLRALSDRERGLGERELEADPEALRRLAEAADGDARRALNALETAAELAGPGGRIGREEVEHGLQRRFARYDKSGEEHYNLISALHKSLRGGDPDASLYWLARMLDAGEDPMYIIRRLVRFASEDIGLADPYALTISINARDAYHFLGSPEGELAIAQAVVYMACAAKSNSSYLAFGQAMADAREKGSLPVPLWIRNAPTRLMKSLGYGKGYKYAHEYEDALTDQEYFPEELAGTVYFRPGSAGRETKLGEYLAKFREFRKNVTTKHPSNESDK
jgi:putative ATPase